MSYKDNGYFHAKTSSGRYGKNGTHRPTGEGLITLIANSSSGNLLALVESYISRNGKKIDEDEIEAALDFYQIKYPTNETKEKKIERLLKHLRFK